LEKIVLEDYYKVIFERSLDGILLTKPGGGIFRANPAICEMLQRTEEEICQIGRSGILDVNDPRLQPALEERARTGSTRVELNFLRKDGSKVPVDLTSVIVKDKEGQLWTTIIIRDMTAFKQAEERLIQAKKEAIYLSINDYLTGVLNRRGFIDRLEQEISRAKRDKSPLSLIMIDLDFFKKINDMYGHSVGDATLQKFVAELSTCIRQYDIPGRFGGDEFIVCLPDTEMQEAVAITERMRKRIEDMEIFHKTRNIKLTACFGIVEYDCSSEEPIDAFVTRADDNMYVAKNEGNSIYYS